MRGVQIPRVIVEVHREQARSHKDLHGTRRSEPAREKRTDNTGIQTAGVIVDVHRGQAASTRICRAPVGASLLAKNAQTTRAFRQPALSLTSIAGKPAPTTGGFQAAQSPAICRAFSGLEVAQLKKSLKAL